LVGENYSLLKTRAAVLAKTGANVVPSSPSELASHVGIEEFDLVVLCHTLREGARKAVIANARRRWPRVRILQIFSRLGEMTSFADPLDAATPIEPEEVLARATELLVKSDWRQSQAADPRLGA